MNCLTDETKTVGLFAGTEIRIRDDVRLWIVEQALNPQADVYRIRCGQSDGQGYQPVKHVHSTDIIEVL